MSSPLWQPSKERMKASNMKAFQDYVAKSINKDLKDYLSLHAFSLEDPERFWELLVDFLPIRFHKKPQKTWDESEREGVLGVKWFEGGQLNYAEHLLLGAPEEQTIQSYIEGEANPRVYSKKDLSTHVAQCQRFLKEKGLVKGDRVASVMANSYETIVIMLATTALGGVFSSCSPDFGANALKERFVQIEPKVLFFTDCYPYLQKWHSSESQISALAKACKSLKALVAVPLKGPPKSVATSTWADILNQPVEPVSFEPMAFSDPLFILYSSGTTGQPKCIVHSVGGTLVQHLKELALHTDLKAGEPLFYYTTCGWMMWNWMVSALALGAPLVIYEGAVQVPNLYRLFEIVEEAKVRVFGTSPKFLATCMKEHLSPKRVGLKNLKTMLTTGSPLLSDHSHWVYEHVKKDLCLSSISGGTDIISCFMLGNPLLPVYPGEIQCLGLGMAVESYGDAGPLPRGEKGELVCTKPFVSMPLGFYGDSGERYRKAYFTKYPGPPIWSHGDFIALTEHHGVIVYGRSDATLNPGGVRIGSAEIYRVVEKFDRVQDSLVVGVTPKGEEDQQIWLFLVLRNPSEAQEELFANIKKSIRTELSPRHVPKAIFQAPAIPYTRSGKKIEAQMSRFLSGEAIEIKSLANDDVLSFYQGLI